MSKKLIAVAAAAALALTGLVAAPAQASTISVVINEGPSATASHGSKTDAINSGNAAMTSGTLDYRTSASTTRNVVRFDVTTTAGTTVEVVSAGGVKVIDAIADADGTARKISAGSTSYSKAAATGATTITFYAFTTSTTEGTVVIQTTSAKATYWIKGVAGAAYNLVDVKFPTTVTAGVAEADSTDLVTYKVTDVFGNELSNVAFGTSAGQVDVKALGASTRTATYSSTRKVYEAAVFSGVSGSVAMSVSLNATDLSTNGFAKPVKYAFASVSAADLAGQITTLKAQVTQLQAQLAALQASTVTKAKYNKLVRKWNRANPNNKVKRVS
jgi:hypothetical protein